MPGFALTAGCRAPVEEVWKLLFDPARFPEWWAGIETVRQDALGEFTQWPTGYPDFPMPQKLRVDEANERVTISCQVADIDIVWQLAEAGTFFLTLTGGEVFMRRDFLEILAHARALHFSVTIFTTGTLLTPETAARVAALHPLSVEVSIYSARPEIHDRVTRIPGSHARSLRALERGKP